MARKNRVSVYDGVYHVTTRIANRAMLLKPDEVKERLMKWIVSIANFSGVEVWGFTVMDNHLHLIVHVPPVPKEYWLDANEEPAAYAFGMRPPECRVPLWNGDSPSLGSLRIGDSNCKFSRENLSGLSKQTDGHPCASAQGKDSKEEGGGGRRKGRETQTAANELGRLFLPSGFRVLLC